MEFKKRLRELRLEKGESQQQIGEIVGASKMGVSHWESGHSEPSIEQLKLLANHFNVTIDYLVGKSDIF